MSHSQQPDIVLIVLDTLRADRLSCYGYPKSTTPHLDAFAETGTLFEHAISPAQWTIPAHGSLFTGEFPSTHGTTQIFDRHSHHYPTLAERLSQAGYQTVGFCNNPLLGVVANDLDRGFETFYNYGGVVPERPDIQDSRPRRAGRAAQRLARVLNRLNRPLQEWLTHNEALLGLMMHPWIVPLWERHINFRGNSRQSISDVVGYLRTRHEKGRDRPLFLYLNLMETHLPFGPPRRFVRRFAPYMQHDSDARRFMQSYNHETYRWISPITQPFSDLQHTVLNDMYDAEVAYEDHLLNHLLRHLSIPEIRDSTLVIITSDHGEGLDHHGYVGHSLVMYEDLVRVPLMIRYPSQFPAHTRVSTPVSTRRIFHTALQAAAISDTLPEQLADEVGTLSLSQSVAAPGPEAGEAFAESYPPQTLLRLMEGRDPEAIETFRCNALRRTIYRGTHKLITVAGQPEELYDTALDPAEVHNRFREAPDLVSALSQRLTAWVAYAESRRVGNGGEPPPANLADEKVASRLRGLGYIE